MPTSKHTSSDLSANQKVNFAKLDAAAQAQVQFDYVVDGPLQIEDPTRRIMTGAVNTAQATAQATAITAAGGINGTLKGKIVAETGKQLGT